MCRSGHVCPISHCMDTEEYICKGESLNMGLMVCYNISTIDSRESVTGNTDRYNASEVLYINIIREPIPRLVSQYYFSRFGDGGQDVNEKRAKWSRSEEEFNETIDECTVNQHRDCSGKKNFYIIPFFCGNNRHCTSPSRRALLRAIYNVEKNFLVVGILEEFELTLKVLERMLPRYFSGAEKLYRTPDMASNASRTATNLKIPPSNETLNILRRNMQYEYEFYEYIKKRLHKQKDELGL
ncbi:putative uronyl 2-sulfotransferase isoform 2 [Apostichopus japonicus]|uniref:Putative uronyl 2-sulfotransferase isoform 2 n=1 Tax=Stichopus japonicus TaxID=307972 RepID=A0A2G8KXQ2_STIJA|nr:putative uronyl 2-sulfotransferase isoform 2 [Apostichopus japonicus]